MTQLCPKDSCKFGILSYSHKANTNLGGKQLIVEHQAPTKMEEITSYQGPCCTSVLSNELCCNGNVIHMYMHKTSHEHIGIC